MFASRNWWKEDDPETSVYSNMGDEIGNQTHLQFLAE